MTLAELEKLVEAVPDRSTLTERGWSWRSRCRYWRAHDAVVSAYAKLIEYVPGSANNISLDVRISAKKLMERIDE